MGTQLSWTRMRRLSCGVTTDLLASEGLNVLDSYLSRQCTAAKESRPVVRIQSVERRAVARRPGITASTPLSDENPSAVPLIPQCEATDRVDRRRCRRASARPSRTGPSAAAATTIVPTRMMPLIAFEPDISGVCSDLVADERGEHLVGQVGGKRTVGDHQPDQRDHVRRAQLAGLAGQLARYVPGAPQPHVGDGCRLARRRGQRRSSRAASPRPCPA